MSLTRPVQPFGGLSNRRGAQSAAPPATPLDTAPNATTPRQPALVAKEAMHRLAREKLPPTPENFAEAYYTIEGTQPVIHLESHSADGAHAARAALSLAAALPFADQSRQAIEQAIRRGAWHAIEHLINEGASMPTRSNVTGKHLEIEALSVAWSETSVMAFTCSSTRYKRTPDLKRTAANLMHSIRHVKSGNEHDELRELALRRLGDDA